MTPNLFQTVDRITSYRSMVVENDHSVKEQVHFFASFEAKTAEKFEHPSDTLVLDQTLRTM